MCLLGHIKEREREKSCEEKKRGEREERKKEKRERRKKKRRKEKDQKARLGFQVHFAVSWCFLR